MSEPRLQGKSHDIPKRLIWAAWLKVKSKGGAAGADGVTIEQFEERLADNLYRLWNRMSSGSYFPGPVRAVEIPKKGGTRVLGIPNVIDRVAQTAAVLALEPTVEKVFHDDSYGYRPGRSPVDAVRVCRQRCFKRDWVVDLDVKAFFDSVPWDLMLKAVARHTDSKWVLLYVERWMKAPMLMPDGSLTHRTKGTPQGGPISPLIANLFLHYVLPQYLLPFVRACRGDRGGHGLVVIVGGGVHVVVPVAMKRVPGDVSAEQFTHLPVGDPQPGRVGVLVQHRLDGQPGAGGGRGDGLHHHFVAFQGPAPPVHRDVGEQPVLHLG
jgi:hypothetical protein